MVGVLVDWINKGHQLSPFNIDLVERKYGAIFVADLSLRAKDGGWTERTYPVFYQPVLKDPSHKHYFALFAKEDSSSIYITSAQAAADVVWTGTRAQSGEIIFSRCHHDYRTSEDGTAMCDGGQDYFRGSGEPVSLRIVGPDFQVVVDGQEASL